ncbi:Glioma tumor suppressor candidate region family protein [Brugia pahangi]
MMSSSGFRPFDDLSEHYEDEWLQLGLEDETLKCSSPPATGTVDFGLTVSTRSCPSPLSHIPTREPYPSEPPPKLSPVSAEQQTFITLSNSRIPSVPPGPSQSILQPAPQVQSSELTSVEYELNPDLSVLSIPSSSPLLVTKPAELQFTQPSVSGLHQNGDFASFVQLEQREKRTVIQSQQHPPGCVQAVNGQWFVQAQVQQVQTSAGTVIAVVPNFCRSQAQPAGTSQNLSQAQVSQSQLIAHPIGNGQAVNTAQPTTVATQHVMQNHSHHQIQQQQPQQIVHAARMPRSLTVGVASGAPQQSHSVMQHLLSQPAISRSQVQTAVQPVTSVPPTTKKQRNSQPRNGRRKNNSQGGTLGSVLIKANKLAAAASTDASINQLLPPSHGIEMRLSVQNSEQVANLSKEISRLQSLQTAYHVDHSAEIKELENKRAQIFFEALAQQHKDKDLLSAVNPKPMTLTAHTRQRNHNRNNHNSGQSSVVVHQVQPSTSYEQQQQPNYEVATPAKVPISYHSSYQISTNYTPAHETLQSSHFNVRNNSQIHQVSTTQYRSYRAAVNQPSVQQNQVRENYMHTVPNTIPQAVILQTEQHRSHRVVREVPCEPLPPPVPLFPPPTLRSSAETAACIAKKKVERTKRINDYFLSLHNSVEHPDVSSPFHDLSDVLQRLLPFHVYSEPDFNSEIMDTFDYHCLRHFVHLNSRRHIIEQRMRSLLCKEAMEGYTKADECLLLSLDTEHERRLLHDEKRMAIVCGREEFVAKSTICNRMNGMDVEEYRKELVPKTIPKLHFDYHTFSESEIAARIVSPFTASDIEDSPVSKSTGSDDEERMLSDVTEEMLIFEETATITNTERDANDHDIKGNVITINGEKNLTTNDWVDSSPSLDLPEITCCTSRRRKDSISAHQESYSPVSAEQMFVVKSTVPAIKSTEQVEAVIALAHATTLKRLSSPVIAEENEGIENCVPIENSSKISEAEIGSCENDSSQVLERKIEGENFERPPIRIKIALTDVSLKNCMNKSSNKKNKEKKKKKKKKRKHCDPMKTDSGAVNGLLPSCSGLDDTRSDDAALHRDDTSHPRILMRITRRNNIVSVTDPRTNHISLHITPKSGVDEEREPPLKVPKLKIRFGRNREEHVVDSERPTVDQISNGAPHEMDKLQIGFGKGDDDRLNRHKRTAGVDYNRKMTIIIPKSVIKNSYVSSCNSDNSISAAVSSNAQFSPNSELSDEEEDEQLRAQADSVISRLNDWGTKNTVTRQTDALSRLVASGPLVTPVLDRLLPSDPWFFSMDVKNHSTVDSNDTAHSHMAWLGSTASHSHSLKTTISISKPN